MIHNEIILEFDPTAISTGLKNFVGRKKDQLQAAGGSSNAFGRQNIRAIADKLYHNWQVYLGEQGKQGTDEELIQYIYRHYGGNPTVMTTLKQKFPNEMAAIPAAMLPSGTPQPTQPTQPTTTTPPTTTPTTTQPTINDHDSFVRYKNFQKRINGLLNYGRGQNGTLDADKIMRSVHSMVRSFASPRRSDKARSWVKDYIDQLKPYAQFVPALRQLGDDPFANVRQRRTPVPSIPPKPVASQTTPDMSQPPEFLRRQQNPPNPGQPPPRGPMHTPPAWKSPTTTPPNMQYPPAFLRRQRSEGQHPHGRLIEATVLNRRQIDAILVALAQVLSDSGEATVQRPQPRSAANIRGRGGQSQEPEATTPRIDVMATKLTPDALNAVRNKVQQLSDAEFSKLQQIANRQTLGNILKSNVTLSNTMIAALVYAAEAMA